MTDGTVIQITGPVVDVEFPQDKLPAIYNALEIKRPGGKGKDGDGSLVVEVIRSWRSPISVARVGW